MASTADARQDPLHPQLPSEQRRQQVAFIVVDHAHQHVAAADVFGFEQLEIGAVAVQHQHAAQPAGQQLAARQVALDDHDVQIRRAVETLGQAQADVTPADDRDALPADVRLVVIRRRTSSSASGVPMTTALSPAASTLSPRGMKNESPRRTATTSEPCGRCSAAIG